MERKDEDLKDNNDYLALILDESTLEYLLIKQWDNKTNNVDWNNIDYKSMDKPSIKLINQLYDFIFCAKQTLPNSLDKWYFLLKKVFQTTQLNVDKLKLQCVTIALFNKMQQNNNNIDKDEQHFHRVIKKYIVHNKQIPFALDKWKDIIGKQIINGSINDKKMINTLSKWAASLVQSKWNLQKELSNIISSHNMKYILYADDGDTKNVKNKIKGESIMNHIVSKCKEKSFGLTTRNNVVFCVETQVIDKYRTINKHINVINECIEKKILQVTPNIAQLNANDIIYLTVKTKHLNDNNNNTNCKVIKMSALHQKLLTSKDLWNRSFFDAFD